MNINNLKYNSTVVNTSIVAVVILFLVVIVCIGLYTSTSGNHVANNPQSEDKITVLQQAFQSILGPRWPYVLLVFAVLLGFGLYFLYLASSSESLIITMSDQAAHRFNIAFIIFIVIFGITMILLSVKQYLDYKKQQSTGNIPNYTPNTAQQKQIMQIMAIVGLGLFVLIGGGLAVWFVFFKPK